MAAEAAGGGAEPDTLSRRIARAIAEAAPPSTAAAAKARLCVLDYLSCALESHELPWCREALAAALPARHGEPAATDATVIGTGRRAPADGAAFVNAVLGHALIRDDMHVGSVSHLGVVVLPVLLAAAEEYAPIRGEALLDAVVCGYEAGARIGGAVVDVDVARRFRPTGIAGPIGAAAGVARLLGLDAEATASAIGLAANTVAGYNEWAGAGGSEMFFHAGFAARNALTAARLAAAGARASPSALDGPAGMLAAFGRRADAADAALFAGRPEIEAVFFKPVPACNFAQSPAQAAQAIALEARPADEDIEQVVVHATAAAAAYPGCDAAGPFEHVLQAKMSIQYCVAAALITGAFEESSYRPAEQPRIRELAARTRLQVDAGLSEAYPAHQGAEVVVQLKDGQPISRRVADVVPATDDEVVARFLRAARRRLGERAAHELHDAVMALASAPDAAAIARLTRPAGS